MVKSRKEKQIWVLFWATFFVSLIVITYFIKSMSPNVDVEIGNEHSHAEQNDTQSDVKQAIDDRLRWIQMEDNMPGVSKHDDNANNNDTIDEPVRENKEKPKQEIIEYINTKSATLKPPTPAEPKQTTTTQAPFKLSKIYVGSYATIEQAIQAQNQLMNLSSTISPFVKELDGKYVLQAGSFANTAKAESVAKEITALGFSATIVKE